MYGSPESRRWPSWALARQRAPAGRSRVSSPGRCSSSSASRGSTASVGAQPPASGPLGGGTSPVSGSTTAMSQATAARRAADMSPVRRWPGAPAGRLPAGRLPCHPTRQPIPTSRGAADRYATRRHSGRRRRQAPRGGLDGPSRRCAPELRRAAPSLRPALIVLGLRGRDRRRGLRRRSDHLGHRVRPPRRRQPRRRRAGRQARGRRGQGAAAPGDLGRGAAAGHAERARRARAARRGSSTTCPAAASTSTTASMTLPGAVQAAERRHLLRRRAEASQHWAKMLGPTRRPTVAAPRSSRSGRAPTATNGRSA